MKTKIKGNGGFTLIELLIVIGIISILAAAIIVAVAPGEQLGRARDASVRSHMQTIATSAYSYKIDNEGEPDKDDFDALGISEPNHPLDGGYGFEFVENRVVVTETSPCVEYDENPCLIITY